MVVVASEAQMNSVDSSSATSPRLSAYEQTLEELQGLQRQFHRMELSRKQKVNAKKIERTNQLRAEYKSKSTHQHFQLVQHRRESQDSMSHREKIEEANRRQRRRESRLRMVEKVGKSALSSGRLNDNQNERNAKRRESAFQKRQLLEQQKAAEKREKFRQKQVRRERNIANAIRQKTKSNYLRQRSFSASASSTSSSRLSTISPEPLIRTNTNPNKENDIDFFRTNLNSTLPIKDRSSTSPPKKQKQRSLSARPRRKTLSPRSERSVGLTRSLTPSFEVPQRRLPFAAIREDERVKRKKKNRFHFMRPTLAKYLTSKQ